MDQILARHSMVLTPNISDGIDTDGMPRLLCFEDKSFAVFP